MTERDTQIIDDRFYRPSSLQNQELPASRSGRLVRGLAGLALIVAVAGSCERINAFCNKRHMAFRNKLESAKMIPHYVRPGETIFGYGANEGISNVFPLYHLDDYIKFVEEKNPKHEKTLLAGETANLPDYDGDGKAGMPNK